jgi:hypothetical protein
VAQILIGPDLPVMREIYTIADRVVNTPKRMIFIAGECEKDYTFCVHELIEQRIMLTALKRTSARHGTRSSAW